MSKKKTCKTHNKPHSQATDNWVDLASTLQEKTMHRMSDINMLISRAGIIIAGIAVLVNCLLEQDLPLAPFILVSTLIILSLFLTIRSLFIEVETPINPRDAINMLNSKQYRNISRRNFSKWKAESFEKSLRSINTEYDKRRAQQRLSFIFFTAAVIALLLFKYINIEMIIKINF